MPLSHIKAKLLARFEDAVRLGGWNVLYLSTDTHPALYRLVRGEERLNVRVFIWTISHGGKGRSASEYRIQNTGVATLVREDGWQNLILGWWPTVDVFAGWDIRQHLGPVSSSPSMQVSEDALRASLLTGFAPYKNQNGETAIAIRPDFLPTYIANLEPLHDSGTLPKEAAILAKLSEDPEAVPDAEIAAGVVEKRRYAIITTKKALRALDFSRRVLGAYGHQCAMCGTQLKLIEGAHILPVAEPSSTDETSNGIALCALHHKAYDNALVTFDPAFKIYVNEVMVKQLKAEAKDGGLKDFRGALRPILSVPPSKSDRPRADFVAKANELRGWK